MRNQPLHDFLFGLPAEHWARSFSKLFYSYLIVKIWLYAWPTYSAMAPWLYKPAGLWQFAALPFPSLKLLIALRLVATAAALAAMFGYAFRFNAAVVFVSMLLFDAWHNGFGFINVEIHLIWFSGLMILTRGPRTQTAADREWASLAFRAMELIVVLAYVQSGISKLVVAGPAWSTQGTTLQFGMMRQGLALGLIVAQQSWLMPLLSSAAVLFELAFLAYYFVPSLRRVLLVISIVFHLTTYALMGIDFFHLWIFSASALLFINKRSLNETALC